MREAKKFVSVCFLLASVVSVAQPREYMKYHLHYGVIKGGEAHVVATDTVWQIVDGRKSSANDTLAAAGAGRPHEVKTRPAIHYFLEGRTTGLADNLFGVHDIYESIVDAETFLPFKSIRNIKEQRYRWYNETFFFHDNDSIYSEKTGGMKVPPNLVDILTAFFYMRHNNFLDKLDHGEEFTMPVYHAGKYFIMTVKYLGTEKVKSKMGTKECYVLAPRVEQGKLFKRADALTFYITKDEYRIPVRLEFDMFIGSLRADLVSLKLDGVEQIKK